MPLETIMPISARLIANKAGYKFRHGEISALRDAMERQLSAGKE